MLDVRSKNLNLEYQITEDDFMAAYEAFWRSGKLGGKRELAWGAVGVIVGVILVALGFLLGWMLFVGGIVLALLVSLRGLLHRRAYRKNPAYSGPTTVIFGEDLIQVENPIGSSQLEWSVYRSAMESDTFFLPMLSKRSFSIIPKRAFDSEAELEAFRGLLESKLGAATRI